MVTAKKAAKKAPAKKVAVKTMPVKKAPAKKATAAPVAMPKALTAAATTLKLADLANVGVYIERSKPPVPGTPQLLSEADLQNIINAIHALDLPTSLSQDEIDRISAALNQPKP